MKQVFPFGSPLKKVEQQDKTPKNVFILGDYVSAVYAKWIDVNGIVKAKALPVASEPALQDMAKSRQRLMLICNQHLINLGSVII